ncbi:MAG: hypothetical protein ACTSYI_06700 [Promethearchaeota archaeon]
MKRQILAVCMLLICVANISQVRADWTPGDDEVAPSKDTYLSLSGTLSEPNNNFGGAETLYVGDGLKGICMTVIAFDLSTLPSETDSLSFSSSCVAYGDATWTMRVSILLGSSWNELEITTLDNDFDGLVVWTNNTANLTDITVTGSLDEITLNLSDYIDEESITLLFCPDLTIDGAWITMQSKENQYLLSVSNPSHIQYTVPEPTDDDTAADDDDATTDDGTGTTTGGIIGGVVLVGIVVIIVMKKKKGKTD